MRILDLLELIARSAGSGLQSGNLLHRNIRKFT
jgi:hypothetical protein